MSQTIAELAEELAQSDLHQHWDGHLPVRLGRIANAHDIHVEHRAWDQPLDGLIAHAQRHGVVAAINTRASSVGQRQTLARLIGHGVERARTDDTTWSFSHLAGWKAETPHDAFADRYSAALLIPADELARLAGRNRGELIRAFAAPYNLIRARAERLGVTLGAGCSIGS